MRLRNFVLSAALLSTTIIPIQASGNEKADEILPDPVDLQGTYVYDASLSDEFNGEVSDMWLMDYMPWWSDTATREQSGTKTRYRFIDADSAGNQSLQIYVNGENRMGEENFQPYYLEKLSGPQSAEAAERYLAATNQKNNWNSKFAGFMAGSKDYLNTFRGSEAPIENHTNYSDAGATTYGYFETRCKFLSMNRNEGLAPAFWFIGMQDDATDLAEVDVFEFLDNYTLDFTIHDKGDPNVKKVTHQIKFTEDMSKDYHTYGILWDETGFSLYVDGEFKYKHDQKIDYRMIPMFSINHHENGWIGSVDGKDHPEERTMDIDYYRVFKKEGTDWELNEPQLIEGAPGVNVAGNAYISLFGLKGTEVDATPMQWFNDGDTTQSVLSGIFDRMGKSMQSSVLPQYLYIDWKTPASFDTIILHAQNAASSAPTLVDVEISEDGKNWKTIQSDVALTWATDSQIAEANTIQLDTPVENNLYARLNIKEANLNAQGRFGLCEVEIGEEITPMEPEYLPLPDAVDTNMKESVFTTWTFNDTDVSATGMQLTYGAGTTPQYTEGRNGGKALSIDGNNQQIYMPLKDDEGNQLKSDEDFTFAMWIKPDAVSAANDDQIVLAHQTGTSGGRPWLFMYSGTLGTYLGAENTFGKLSLQSGEWQYVAVTFHVTDADQKKGEVTLYVNGQQDTKKVITYEDDSLSNPQLLLGRHKSGSKGYYHGAMADVLLLDKALAPQDMAALYAAEGDVTNVQGETYDLTKVLELPDISGMVNEMTLADVVLPAQVSAVFDKTYVQNVSVTWSDTDLQAIDFSRAAVYTINGTLDLSAYPQTTNTQNIQVQQRVVVKAPVTLAELSAVLEKINALDENEYTPTSVAEFKAAVGHVQTKETQLIIGSYPNLSTPQTVPAYATQEIVDGVTAELNEAFALLVKKESTAVDDSELRDLLAQAQKLSKDDYTADSWDRLAQAMKAASALLESDEFTQSDADSMTAALQKAINALEKQTPSSPQESNPGTTKPSTGNPTEAETDDNASKEPSADTAAENTWTIWMGLSAAAGMSAYLFYRRRTKEQ